jgi:hypothetical protein
MTVPDFRSAENGPFGVSKRSTGCPASISMLKPSMGMSPTASRALARSQHPLKDKGASAASLSWAPKDGYGTYIITKPDRVHAATSRHSAMPQ